MSSFQFSYSSQFLILFELYLCIGSISTARICIYSVVTNPLSYRTAYEPLLESLIDKGHEVTLFSSFPYKGRVSNDSRFDYIFSASAKSYIESFNDYISPLTWRAQGKSASIWDMQPILSLDTCNILLQSPEVLKWIATSRTRRYDLFIVDSLWNECGIGLSHVFGAKLVLFSFHSNLQSWNLDALGNPLETYSIPDMQFEITPTGTFFQRLRSTFRAIRWYIYRNAFTFYQTRKFFEKHLGNTDFPSMRELEEGAKLHFVNSHFSEELHARSLSELFVRVGGIHIRWKESSFPNGEVVEVVKKFLRRQSSSKSKGFILSSIGCSPETSRHLRNETLRTILDAMGMAKELVDFVFLGNEALVGRRGLVVPQNVLRLDDCSQNIRSLLGHPDVKGLISHGDLLDIQEAIYHSVPIIILPVALDQDSNAERIVRSERGIRLEITRLTKSDFVAAIQDLLKNEAYKVNMKKASSSLRDRQVKPLDSALWWIDYILRNPNIEGLKSVGIGQPWYIRRALDIWFPIFGAAGIGIFIGLVIVVLYVRKQKTPGISKVLTKSTGIAGNDNDGSWAIRASSREMSDETETSHRRRSTRLANVKGN